MMCPICNSESYDFIVDTMICTNCNHIFKKIPIKKEHHIRELHLFENPIDAIRNIEDYFKDQKYITFKFPSVMFQTLDIIPENFYNSEHNHFFNQISLMIFLNRCDLEPILQTNEVEGKGCFTTISCKKIR